LLVERERVLVAFDVVHLDAADDIARLTERLLREADANGRFPRPVEDIIAAANLVEPAQSLLAEEEIRDAPAHVRDALRKIRYKVDALLDRKARPPTSRNFPE
jgi:hypothetical protein